MIKAADPLERIFSRVEPDGECLTYVGCGGKYGYKYFTHGHRTTTVHRWVYELLVGEVPKELHIDHICNNRRCVNIEHLQAITPKENVLRSRGLAAQNARKTHCVHGHEFTKANTYVNDGKRACKTCNDIRRRARLEKLK